MAEILIRPMEPTEADLAHYCACFEAHGAPRDPAHLRWQLFDSPAQRLVATLALGPDPTTGEIVPAATYGAIGLRADLAGKTVPAVQAIDALTDARFRGQGLFKRVGHSVADRVQAEGNAFIYGFPNSKSAHGHFERLGWTRLGPLPMVARPLRTGPILGWSGKLAPLAPFLDFPIPVRRHRLRTLEIRPLERFDPKFDQLWERFSARIGVGVRRDAAYLNWRLVDRPGVVYKTLSAHREGELVGFVSWRETTKHGGGVGYLMELIAEPDRPWVGRVLLAAALRRMRDADIALVQGMSLPHAPLHRAWQAEGFLPLPKRLWSTELHFGARGFTAEASAVVDRRENWYLSLCDSDTV